MRHMQIDADRFENAQAMVQYVHKLLKTSNRFTILLEMGKQTAQERIDAARVWFLNEPRVRLKHAARVEMTRNLIYHIYPVASNNEWRSNVARLVGSWGRFNGRKIIGLVLDKSCTPYEEVRKAFPNDSAIEWLVQPNDPVRGETITFFTAAKSLKSLNPNEITFYAHAKGVSENWNTPSTAVNLRSIREWRSFLYRFTLETSSGRLDKLLREYACIGCFRKHGRYREEATRPSSTWHYSGTFWWFNHARYFSNEQSLKLGLSRWAVERHLGELFPIEESYCITEDRSERLDLASQPDGFWVKAVREACSREEAFK